MNINLTLIVQMLVFIALIWFTMKFVWPMILGPMDERSRKIATGLAAAEKGQKDLARPRSVPRRSSAKRATGPPRSSIRPASAPTRSSRKPRAPPRSEAQRLVGQAQMTKPREPSRARDSLRQEVGKLAVEGASRLLGREIDPKTHAELLDKLAAEIARG